LRPRSPRQHRRAFPKKIGPIGTGTAGLGALETRAGPAQILPARLAPSAGVWPSSGLPATARRFDARTGLAATLGPVRVRHVWSELRLGKGAVGFMGGFRPAPGPQKARRGSQWRSAGDGLSGEFVEGRRRLERGGRPMPSSVARLAQMCRTASHSIATHISSKNSLELSCSCNWKAVRWTMRAQSAMPPLAPLRRELGKAQELLSANANRNLEVFGELAARFHPSCYPWRYPAPAHQPALLVSH